jgi:hypothetical protein
MFNISFSKYYRYILAVIIIGRENWSTQRKQTTSQGSSKPGEVGNFFALVSMKSPNFCQKAKF